MLSQIKEDLIQETILYKRMHYHRTPIGYFIAFRYDKFWKKITKVAFEKAKKAINYKPPRYKQALFNFDDYGYIQCPQLD